MSSQGSQRMASTALCLPLVKYSYATVHGDSLPIPWLHLSSRNSLFAIFETAVTRLEDGRTEDRFKFKVLRDPEPMEELDLLALSAAARRCLASTSGGAPARMPDVTVVVKVPMVAIKYPLAQGQIKRFQIRFASHVDYYEALKMFAQADVPTVEAGQFPPSTARGGARASSSIALTPNDSVSQIGVAMDSSVSQLRTAATHVGPPAAIVPTRNIAVSGNMAEGLEARHPPPPALVHALTDDGPLRQPEASRSVASMSNATTLVNDRIPVVPRLRPVDLGLGTEGLQNILGITRAGGCDEPVPSVPRVAAPSTSNDSANLGLPPKRNLPFPNTVIGAKPNAQSNALKMFVPEYASGERSARVRFVADEETEPATSPTPKEARKRAPAKVAADGARSKKLRVSKPRKRPGKNQDDAHPVPSVDELMQQVDHLTHTHKDNTQNDYHQHIHDNKTSSTTSRPDVASGPPAVDFNTKNQFPTTISRPEMTRVHVTCSVSRSMSLTHPATLLNHDAGLVTQAGEFTCTPANQAIVTATPKSPAPGHTAAPSTGAAIQASLHGRGHIFGFADQQQRADSTKMPQGPTVTREDAEPTHMTGIDPGSTHITPADADSAQVCADPDHAVSDQGPPAPTNEPLLPHHSEPTKDVATVAQNLLASDLRFADGAERLQAWSALPSVAKNHALGAYFCRAIRDPSFVNLCKTLETFWERGVLEGKFDQDLPLNL